MSLVDEVAIWSAIAGRMTNEMELDLAAHAEVRARNSIIVEETESFIWIMRRAAGEWHRALAYLRREHTVLADHIAEERRRAAADREVEEMRRQTEVKETANALRREVDSLSSLRDRLRDEVAHLTGAQQTLLSASSSGQSAAAPASLAAASTSPVTRGSGHIPGSGAVGGFSELSKTHPSSHTLNNAANVSVYSSLGSPIPADPPKGGNSNSYSYATAGGSAATAGGLSSSYGHHHLGAGGVGNSGSGSLGVLRSVRDQLREIRENSNVSPVRGSTPQRASSPSAQQWKDRLSKLQGDLRTLRSELGATPQRPPATTVGY